MEDCSGFRQFWSAAAEQRAQEQRATTVSVDRNTLCVVGMLAIRAMDTLRLAPQAYHEGGKAIVNALLALGVADEALEAVTSTADLRDLFADQAR